MSAGTNISGLAPLGSKKLPPSRILPEVPNEMTDFDLIPDRSNRGQELLSPLVRRNIPQISPHNPALKPPVGTKGRKGLFPLEARRNLQNDLNNCTDPFTRSLVKKKPNLAPLGVGFIELDNSSEDYQSPIKRRVGANRIISPLTKIPVDIPMHVMGISRANLNQTLRPPKCGLSPLTKHEKEVATDGVFPDDGSVEDASEKSVLDMQKTLRDTNIFNETGHRARSLIAPEKGSIFDNPSQTEKSMHKSKRRVLQHPDEDNPWSTTTKSSYIY